MRFADDAKLFGAHDQVGSCAFDEPGVGREGQTLPSRAFPTPGAAVAHDAQGNDVGLSDEVGDEGGCRPLVEGGGIGDLLEATVVHDHDAIRKDQRLFLVVGHVDSGDVELLLQALDLELHVLAQLPVERAERFVHEQHQGIEDQRACKGDALLLPARELVGIARTVVRKSNEFERVGDHAPAAGLGTLRIFRGNSMFSATLRWGKRA